MTFGLGMVFITFAISIGFVFKLTDLIAGGVPWQPIARFFVYTMPTAVVKAIPLACLVSCLLIFGRLSDDGEVMAMRTLGLGMGRIVRSTLWVVALLVAVSLYINHELEPRAHLARRTQDALLHSISPLDVIEEGRFFTAIPGLTMYVGRKKDDRLRDVRIYDLRDPEQVREIHARRGTVTEKSEGRDLAMSLEEVRITPFSREIPQTVYLDEWHMQIPDLGKLSTYTKDEEDLVLSELLYRLAHVDTLYPMLDERDRAVQRMVISFELHRRTAMSFSCLALALVGIPLGIKSHRKSTGIGVAMSLVLYLVFYLLSLLANSLVKVPAARADLIIWLPIVVFVGVGILLLNRRG